MFLSLIMANTIKVQIFKNLLVYVSIMQYLKSKPKRISGFSYKPNALIRRVGPQPLDEAVITSVANNDQPDYRASPDFLLDLLAIEIWRLAILSIINADTSHMSLFNPSKTIRAS